MSGEQQLRAAVQLAQTGMLTQRAARAIDYFSQHGVQCEACRAPDGQIGVAYRGRWYTPGAFNTLFADVDGNGDTDAQSDAQSDEEAREQARREAREQGLLTYDDIVAAQERRQRTEEGAGAVVWAFLALGVLAALAGAVVLWTQAHGFPGH